MTPQTSLPMTDPPTRGAPPGTRSRLARRAGAALAVLGGGALAWQGGLAGLLGLAVAGALAPWLLCGTAGGGAAEADAALDEPRVSGGRVGAEVMVAQVVPVWGKQLDISRDAASHGLDKLLETFANLSGTLGNLAQQLDQGRPTLDAGAIDGVLADGSPGHAALAALMAPSQRAFAQRDAAVAELGHCANAVIELRQLGRQAREIGKHTRLVAFNASIEANRGSGQGGAQGSKSDSGSQAVANETRMLAGRMAEVGEQVDRLVARLEKSLTPARLHAEINDTPADELQLELALRARESLNALMAGLGGAMHSSHEVRAAASALQAQLEETFVLFQFGDRISQMLSIISNDMQNFGRWVGANPYATQSDAADWLANLERGYTTDEQRAQHHGNVHIDRGSEIEFF